MRTFAFTGTRHGMTEAQKETFRRWVRDQRPDAVHHGDCVGADADAHHICQHLRVPLTVIHPAANAGAWRAHCRLEHSNGAIMWRDAAAPLARNKRMVDEGDMLVACPKEDEEVLRSGTWATMRYASKRGKSMLIIWPCGSMGGGL